MIYKKINIALVAGILTAALTGGLHAQTLQLSYNFNGSATSTGAYAGATLTLVSGAALSTAGTGLLGGTDQALNINGTGMGSGNTGGNASFAPATTLTANSFTYVVWYKSPTALGNNARLMDTNIGYNVVVRGGGTGVAGGDANTTVGEAAISGAGGSNVPQQSGGSTYTNTGTWVFFAVTFDATANSNAGQTTFYKGSTVADSAVQVSQTAGNAFGTSDPFTLFSSGMTVSFGNRSDLSRPVSGLMDDIAVYTAADGSGALSLSALRGVQDSNLGVVPEPSAWALMLGGLGFLGFVTRQRRNSLV